MKRMRFKNSKQRKAVMMKMACQQRVSKKISILEREGSRPRKQNAAIAFSTVRKEHPECDPYDTPVTKAKDQNVINPSQLAIRRKTYGVSERTGIKSFVGKTYYTNSLDDAQRHAQRLKHPIIVQR